MPSRLKAFFLVTAREAKLLETVSDSDLRYAVKFIIATDFLTAPEFKLQVSRQFEGIVMEFLLEAGFLSENGL